MYICFYLIRHQQLTPIQIHTTEAYLLPMMHNHILHSHMVDNQWYVDSFRFSMSLVFFFFAPKVFHMLVLITRYRWCIWGRGWNFYVMIIWQLIASGPSSVDGNSASWSSFANRCSWGACVCQCQTISWHLATTTISCKSWIWKQSFKVSKGMSQTSSFMSFVRFGFLLDWNVLKPVGLWDCGRSLSNWKLY